MLSTLRSALLCAALACASCQRTTVTEVLAPAPSLLDIPFSPALRERLLASEPEPLFEAIRRPQLVATIPFSYAALPTIGAARPASGDRGAFEVTSRGDTHYALHIADGLLVEVEVGSRRYYSLLRPRAQVPHPRSMPPRSPPCAPGRGVPRSDVTNAAWEGIRVSTWQDDAIDYVRYHGSFDFITCRGKPSSVAETRAVALIPKLLYAYRSCEHGCGGELEDPERVEELTIVGPSSAWASATVGAPEQRKPHLGSFSHVRLAVARGGAASALFTFSGEDLAHFVGRADRATRAILERDTLRAEVIQLTIEVVWLAGDSEPSSRIYLARPATRSAAELLRLVISSPLIEP